jgi:hypothetical protein
MNLVKISRAEIKLARRILSRIHLFRISLTGIILVRIHLASFARNNTASIIIIYGKEIFKSENMYSLSPSD